MRIALLLPAALCGLLAALAPVPADAEAVSLTASDGATVFADYVPAKAAGGRLILLFHQAGSNRGEYAPIAPVLAQLGYATLALDQRAGGSMWGRTNETVQHLGHSAGYGEALRDLEAALAWAKAKEPGGKIILWGSSYSAALVFLLAAKHPEEVAAVLAFSP